MDYTLITGSDVYTILFFHETLHGRFTDTLMKFRNIILWALGIQHSDYDENLSDSVLLELTFHLLFWYLESFPSVDQTPGTQICRWRSVQEYHQAMILRWYLKGELKVGWAKRELGCEYLNRSPAILAVGTGTWLFFQVVSICHVKAKPSCFLINLWLDTAALGRNMILGKHAPGRDNELWVATGKAPWEARWMGKQMEHSRWVICF